MRNDLNIDQSLSLIHETETAIMLLDEGIRVISEWDGGQDHRIRGLFSTSQGFERLLKLTMTLILTGEGKPPSSKDLKREYGHHLLQLLDDILNKAKDDAEFAKTQRLLYDIPTIGMTKTEIRNRPPFQDDIAFCRSDRVLREMFDIFGEFGTGGRYHNFDVLLDKRSRAGDPMERWEALEMAIFDEEPRWLKMMVSDTAQFSRRWYPYLASRQVETLQRAARFLVRLWTLGPAQQHGKRLSGLVSRFLSITDDKLSSVPSLRSAGPGWLANLVRGGRPSSRRPRCLLR
ncbi:MAG: hypothetical protein OXF75_09145 [Acidimicrobiaceae bacterium]|nr:hypothetical protein [Acidimicrobiaceae bacterium]